MKKDKNNKGFSGLEFLTIACLCGIISCVFLSVAIATSNIEKVKTMRYKAQLFKNNANAYAMVTHKNEDTIYLWELIDKEISTSISSPFSKNSNCDIRNSYVKISKDKSIVTLKCDDYLIYNADLSKDKIDVYLVSEWQNKYPSTNDIIDTEILYNYKKDDKVVLDNPVREELFLKQFNDNENTNYESIYDIKHENIRIYGKTYYRTRKAILELSK